MSVKISKLWNDTKFQNLTNDSKLLYIYLATNPNIMSVGVINLNIDLATLQLNSNIDIIRGSTKELVESGYIKVYKYDNCLYFVVIDHFNTLPKADSTVAKINRELKTLPDNLVKNLDSLGIKTNRKVVDFEIPSEEDILDFAASKGYIVDAKQFSQFYLDQGKKFGKEGQWVDSKGKQVKDWRAKLRLVWFRDENKLKEVKGAPKGFEFFHITFDGKSAYPDYWKDGKPFSKNFVVTKELQKEYERRKKSS